MYTILCIMTCRHFLKKNEWITNVLGLREHKVRSNPVGISGINGIEKKGDSSYDHTFTPEGIWKDKSGAGRTGEKGQRVS